MPKPFKFFPSEQDQVKIDYLVKRDNFSTVQRFFRYLLDKEYDSKKHRDLVSAPLLARERRALQKEKMKSELDRIRAMDDDELTDYLKEIEYIPEDNPTFNTSGGLGKYFYISTEPDGNRYLVAHVCSPDRSFTSTRDCVESIDTIINKLIKKKLI